MPDTNDLFGEEDIDGGGPLLNNGSATSTPRASLLTHNESNNKTASTIQQSQSTSLRSPALTSLSPAAPSPNARPANTYENTPVSPAQLPVDASVSLLFHVLF